MRVLSAGAGWQQPLAMPSSLWPEQALPLLQIQDSVFENCQDFRLDRAGWILPPLYRAVLLAMKLQFLNLR